MSEVKEQHQITWEKTARIFAEHHPYGKDPFVVLFNIPYQPEELKGVGSIKGMTDVRVFQFGRTRTIPIDCFRKNQHAAKRLLEKGYRKDWWGKKKQLNVQGLLEEEDLCLTHQLGNVLFRVLANHRSIKYAIIKGNEIVRSHKGGNEEWENVY